MPGLLDCGKIPIMFLALLASTLVLTNLSDTASAVSRGDTNASFDVVGSTLAVGSPKNRLFVLHDRNHVAIFKDATEGRNSRALHPGSRARAKGRVSLNEYDYPVANCTSVEFLAEGTPPAVKNVSASDLKDHAFDGDLVRVQGVVKETFRDEIDPKYMYLTLADQGLTYSLSVCDDMDHDLFLRSLIDVRISAVGIYSNRRGGLRKMSNWTVTTYETNGICILTPAPRNPYEVPSLSAEGFPSPSEVAAMGKRKISGRVTAVRKEKDFLIVDIGGQTRRIRPRDAECPSYGDVVEAVGYPETDLYRLNLGDALWRKTGETAIEPEQPVDADIARILTDGNGHLKINPLFHGKAIRLTGTVIDIPSGTRQVETLTLKCGEFSIPVDISANSDRMPDFRIGCQLSVTGTCIVETDSWRPYSTFPHATGITLVVRRPEDVRVVSQPPWWTPGRLMVVISSLLLALLAFIVWNRMLNRLVARRSRALIKEQLALAEAELKVDERTRLAIELHDSLSQNLAAVAFQIVATKGATAVSRDETMDNLNAAERMLLSCRTELKRCLWDLRNDTFDVRNMTDVVRKVLAPVQGNAQVSIRFNVDRSRLDDSTLHAVICIIRELASNAIRHGRASHVVIAGDLTDGILSFSVRDDGCGFDPSLCKGSVDGHFGLEGIRDRVKRFRGVFDVTSSPGGGSYAKIRLPLSPNLQEETQP